MVRFACFRLPAGVIAIIARTLVLTLSATTASAANDSASDGKGAAPVISEQTPFAVHATDWNQVLNWVQRRLNEKNELAPAQAQELLSKVRSVRLSAEQAKEDTAEQVGLTKVVLEALGPSPGELDPPEPKELTAKRKPLHETLALHRAHLAQAELAITQTRAIEEVISTRRREQLLDRLQRRAPQPWSPTVWAAAVSQATTILAYMIEAPTIWYAGTTIEEREGLQLTWLIFVLAVGAGIGATAARVLLRYFGCNPDEVHPSYSRRLGVAIIEGVARGLVPAALCAAGFLWVDAHISGLFADMVRGLIGMAFFLVVAAGLSRAVLAPNQPAWRLTALPSEKARTLHRRLLFLAVVSALDMFFHFGAGSLNIGRELQSVYRLLFLAMEATSIVLLGRESLWKIEDRVDVETSSRFLWTTLRRSISVVVVASVAATVLGFAELGTYGVHNLIISSIMAGGLWLLHGLAQEMVTVVTEFAPLSQRLSLTPRTLQTVGFWSRAIIRPLLFLVGVMLIAPLWGAPRDDLIRWAGLSLTGIPLGSVTLSLVDVVTAIVVFLIAMGVTKRLQRRLSEHILPATRLDASVQHSLGAISGYAGVVIAVALAVAVVGIDLRNLALVAGALSVGIGFGLQNIVNNFVSGLILLVERPIRVGDWVVVGQSEGIVRRISIRATELETWERASVVIPNADILSSKVMNWTLKDKLGRIDIRVCVAYGSDLDKTRQMLLAVAHDHPQVLEWPAPFVLFQHFGDSGLEFELRAYTNDVLGRARYASDIRFAIERYFRTEGIQIPYPQRMVHVVSPALSSSALAIAAGSQNTDGDIPV